MTVSPENDPDGVVDRDTTDEVHENVREGTEGVETKASGTGDDQPAAGLIGGGASGIGEMTDPRYIAQR
jgi:hypothetical protein